jgi:ABC-type antimicrobial peptide transport system permease subunit
MPNEIWLGNGSGESAASLHRTLGTAPFDVLRVESRAALESDLRGDPLARGALVALATAAAASLALALTGLLLLLVSDVRDERRELFDLEAQGVAPATLRRHLRIRGLVVAALGLAGGLATAAVLLALVVDLVALTANATAPAPPLVLGIDWALVALFVVAYAVLAAVLVAAATKRGYRLP